MKVDVFDIAGKKVDKIDLPETVFKAEINPNLMAQAVRVYLANQRQGTQSAKTRSEVSGSGRKIYRQKGTGSARHGDRYAPIFVGGGVAFPPKPRNFSLKISKKAKRKALFSAISQKQNKGGVIIVDGLEKVKAKTKEMVKILSSLINLTDLGKLKILFVLPGKKENLILAARNIKKVSLIPVSLLSTYTVLNSDKIIFLKDSIKKIEEVFLKENQKPKKTKSGMKKKETAVKRLPRKKKVESYEK